jgi:SLOG in TRPM, prokaryote
VSPGEGAEAAEPSALIPPGVPTATVARREELDAALIRLGVARDVPVILLIGGASGMESGQAEAAEAAIRWGVAPVAAELGATVVDGGTDAGVMRLAGAARIALDSAFPLVGVVAEALLLTHADMDQPRAFPEPNHSHLVVVPGSDWGDETPWLFDVAQWIAGTHPIRTVLVNGGPIARAELEESIRRGIPAIAIRGTGRAADDVSAEGFGDPSTPPYHSGLIDMAEATDVPGLRAALGAALRGGPWTKR